MPLEMPHGGSNANALESVRRALETAWDEEPPRSLSADELCQMFRGSADFHDQIRAAYPEWRRQLLQEDISGRLRDFVDKGLPIREQDLADVVGEHVELLDWARAEAEELRARIVPVPKSKADELPAWTDEQFLDYANRHLQLKDYEGDRATYNARRLRPGGGARKRIQRDFELTGVVGKGGLGVVFSAIDHVMHRSVAIKMVRPDRSRPTGAFDALTGEAQIAAKLEHPNILPVYGVLTQLDADAGDFEPAYVMRLLPAQRNDRKAGVRTLHDEIKDLHAQHGGVHLARSPEFRRLLQRFVDVCRGVSLAHSRLVVHCDLKPKNIVSGPFGESLVHDWGICKVLDKRDTIHDQDGTSIATSVQEKGFRALRGASYEWCSPEHRDLARERDVRQPADVFALGMILHCILTDRFPTLRKPSESPETPEMRLKETASGTDPQLWAIVTKATAAEPWNRYIGRYERQWYEEKKRVAALPASSPISETPGVEQLGDAVQNWLDASARAQIEHPFRRTIRRLIVSGTIAALLISTIVALTWWARERTNGRSINQLAGFAFSLAPQLGDADLDSRERLHALDDLLQTTKDTGSPGNPIVQRGLAGIQLGRCKVLRRLSRFREAEEAAMDARRLLEALVKSTNSPDDKSLLLNVLHDLTNVEYERGNIPGMREAVDAAFRLEETLDADTAETVDWLLLRSVTQQKSGSYHAIIGNPFRCERAQANAVRLAKLANEQQASDKSLLNLAKAHRLHSDAVAEVALVVGPPNQAILKRSLSESMQASATLERCSHSKKDSRAWNEERYQMVRGRTTTHFTMKNLSEGQSILREVDQQLLRLRIADAENPEWHRQQIASDVTKAFFQPVRVGDVEGLRNLITSIDDRYKVLRDKYPELIAIQCRPELYTRSLVALTMARHAKDSDRDKFLDEAEESLKEYQAALSPWAERMTEALSMAKARVDIEGLRFQIAAYRPNREVSADSPSENKDRNRRMLAFYEARLRDDPNEPTWKQLVVSQLIDLSAFSVISKQLDQARQFRAEAVRLSRELIKAAPNDPYVCRHAAQALLDTSGLLTEHDLQASDSKASLALFGRVCELTSAEERYEALVLYDSACLDIALKLRRPDSTAAYAAIFGPYDFFQREWREQDERLFVGEMTPVTPWRSPGGRAIVIDALLGNETVTEENDIGMLELYGSGFRKDSWNRDREVVVRCVDTLRQYRDRSKGAATKSVDDQMEAWLVRSAAATINRLQARGELGKWLSWIGQHTDKELQVIHRTQPIGWNSSRDTNKLWREMRYADLARSAIDADGLDEWFALVNDEFRMAAALPRTAHSSVSFAEDMVFRQLADDVAAEAELREKLLSYIRDHGGEIDSWGPSFRRALGVIASLSNDPFLANRLHRDSVLIGVRIRPRIESEGLRRRQFAAVREFSENVLVDAHCELELGRPQESLRLLDSLAPDTPLVAGWRARARLEALRRESLDLEDGAEMIRQLGDVAPANPETDFQQAFVAAYVKVLRSQSPTDAAALAELAKHPYCSDYVWALMLVGDAWMRAGDEQRAAEAYGECGQEFSPGTTDDDRARKWLNTRRGKLRIRS